MQILCSRCGLSIPKERLAIVPESPFCVRCSPVERVMGRLVYSHKTAPELNVMSAEDFYNLHQLDRHKNY